MSENVFGPEPPSDGRSDEQLREQIGELQGQHTADEKQQRVDRDLIRTLEADGVIDRQRIAELEAAGVVDREKITNLEVALVAARRIGAAIGIIMTRHNVTEDAAFDLLRRASQIQHRKLREVAADVVYTGDLERRPD